MPVGFTIRVDTASVELALAGVKQGVPRATTRAINRTLTTVRAAAGREIAADIGVPVRQVTASIALMRARFDTLRGLLRVTGRRIPLIALGARGPEPSGGKGQGVSYALGGERRRIQEAFIATMRSGHRGVFKRKLPSLRKSAGALSKNLPIVELFGPSIPRVAAKESILSALKSVGARTLERNLQSEIRFLRGTARED